MKKPDLNKWNYDKSLEGLLFFAQSLEEMLFHHTIDTYKAPALNLRTNIFELQYLALQVEQNLIRQAALEPVLEELKQRFETDPIIASKKSNIWKEYLEKIQKFEKKPKLLMTYCTSLLTELSDNYWNEIKEEIKKCVREPKEKKRIIQLSSVFVTEAEQNGFSRNFIYYKTNNFFFNNSTSPKKIENIDQISDYLSEFTNKSINWQVIFKGADSLSKLKIYQDLWKEPLKTEIINHDIEGILKNVKLKKYFSKEPNNNFYVLVDIPQKDRIFEPVTAKSIAISRIEMLNDMYSFITHNEKFVISKEAIVINKDSKEESLIESSKDPMVCGIRRDDKEDIEKWFKLLLQVYSSNHFSENSTRKIAQSVEFHRAALDSDKLETKLVDLWTSLEGFFPSPSDESSRIESFIDYLLPSQTLTYSKKIFQSLSEDLYYSSPNIREIIQQLRLPVKSHTLTGASRTVGTRKKLVEVIVHYVCGMDRFPRNFL